MPQFGVILQKSAKSTQEFNFKNNLYTSIFTSAGVGEYYLEKELGLISAVSCEIVANRAKFYKELYPQTEMVCGDITEKEVFEKLVKLHLEKGCCGVMASPVCRDFTLANYKRDPNSKRANLYKYVLKFVRRTNPIWVVIENSDQMLKVKVNGKIVALKIVDALKAMGYNVAYGVQDSCGFETPQHRRRTVILAHKTKNVSLPTPSNKIITLRDAIGNLPILECGQKSSIKWHDASMFKWTASQIAVMSHTPSGRSAHDNPAPWTPVNADGNPSGAKFRCSFQRRNWDDACNAILQDSKSISGFRTCHPGNFIGYDSSGLPVYDSARPLTILELLRVTGLPDDYPIPNWASDNLIRQMMGECWVPKHALACLRQII